MGFCGGKLVGPFSIVLPKIFKGYAKTNLKFRLCYSSSSSVRVQHFLGELHHWDFTVHPLRRLFCFVQRENYNIKGADHYLP